MMSIHESSLEGADAATDPATGETDGVPQVKLGDLEALRGVVKFPVRIKCATLAWNTLTQGLDESVSEKA
jgi:nitrogen fixation NifU-like protein